MRDYIKGELSEKNWKSFHTDIIVMTHAGHNNEEISKRVNKHYNTVAKIKKSPYFQQRLNSYVSTYQQTMIEKRTSYITDTDLTGARKIIDEACKKAAEIVVEMAENCEDPRTKLAACKDILDRAALKPIEITQTSERVYTTEEVEHAQKTLAETVAIVERLNSNTSPFVLGESSKDKLVSSVTDQGSDDSTDEVTTV